MTTETAVQVTKACRNCGAEISGIYCGNCGQKDRGSSFDAGELLSEAVDSVVRLDGKLWHTVIALTKNPGKVALDYAEGKRARYVNPLRYCFACIAVSVGASLATGEFDRITESMLLVTQQKDDLSVTNDFVRFFTGYINVLMLLSVPMFALALRWLFWRSGHGYAANVSFACFVVGHAALLGLVGTVINSYVYFLGIVPSLVITNIVYIYGTMRFYGRGFLVSCTYVSLAYLSSMLLISGVVVLMTSLRAYG